MSKHPQDRKQLFSNQKREQAMDQGKTQCQDVSGWPKSWSGFNSLASSSSSGDLYHPRKAVFRGCLWTNFPGETVDFRLQHAIHILKAKHLRLKMGCLGAILVHPVRRQNFAGKLPIWFYNIWDCEVYHHLCKNGIVCLWGMHVSGVKGNGALYFGATVIHGQPRGDDDGDPQYSRWQR